MNNKDLFKKALENEMPDLESVREKCFNSEVKKEKSFLLIKSTNAMRFIPAVACLMIIVIAIATIGFTEDSRNLIYNKLNPEETTSATLKEQGKKNNKNKNNKKEDQYSHHYNNDSGATQVNTTQITELTEETREDEVRVTFPNQNNLGKLPAVSYISFDSFSQLCSIVSTFEEYDSNVIFETDQKYKLSIPSYNLSMILENRLVYGFSFDGNVISNSGTISNDFCRGLTGCKFYTSYNNNSYTIGYSTYGNAFGGDIIETITTAQGYNFYYLGDGTYVAYIDDFCFAVQDSNDNFEETKDFIENLNIFSKAI